jgi:hypothetical protein
LMISWIDTLSNDHRPHSKLRHIVVDSRVVCMSVTRVKLVRVAWKERYVHQRAVACRAVCVFQANPFLASLENCVNSLTNYVLHSTNCLNLLNYVLLSRNFQGYIKFLDFDLKPLRFYLRAVVLNPFWKMKLLHWIFTVDLFSKRLKYSIMIGHKWTWLAWYSFFISGSLFMDELIKYLVEAVPFLIRRKWFFRCENCR